MGPVACGHLWACTVIGPVACGQLWAYTFIGPVGCGQMWACTVIGPVAYGQRECYITFMFFKHVPEKSLCSDWQF